MATKDIRFKISVDTSEIKEATKALQAQGNEAKELKEDFDKVNVAANKANKEIESGSTKTAGSLKGVGSQIKDHARDINLFGVNAGQAFDTFDGGIGKAVRGLSLFKVALASTGIGLLVVAVGSLVAYFTKTEKGAESLERAMAAVGAVVGVLIGKAAKLGESIVSAVSSPVESLKALGKIILENIINRFTAVGVILDGIVNMDFKKVANGFIQAGTGVQDVIGKVDKMGKAIKQVGNEASAAATLTMKLTRELQDIEDAEKNLRLEVLKSINQRQLLERQSRNESLSAKEKLDLLKQAAKIEIDIVNKQFLLQQRKVKALEDENKMKLASGEIDTGNKTDELRTAEEELEQLRGNSLELLAKFQNREVLVIKKGNKNKRDARQEGYEAEVSFLQRHEDDKLDIVKDNAEKTIEETEKIYQTSADEIGKITDITTQEQADSLSFQLSEHERTEKEKTEKTREQAAARQQIERAATQLAFEVANGFFELASNRRDAELMDIQSKKEQELRMAGDNKQQQALINNKYAQQEKAIKIKQAQADKNQALFNIVLNTAVAIAKASPVVPLMALAAAIGAIQFGVANSRPIPKFNKGTKSVPGIDTGDDSVLAMLRPKEGVMPVDRMNDYQPAFDAIFDRKVPAELMNGLAMNYGRVGKTGGNSYTNNTLDTDRIIKAIEKKQETHINIDKNGIKTYIKSGFAETVYTNNHFSKG